MKAGLIAKRPSLRPMVQAWKQGRFAQAKDRDIHCRSCVVQSDVLEVVHEEDVIAVPLSLNGTKYHRASDNACTVVTEGATSRRSEAGPLAGRYPIVLVPRTDT